jgi:hypothetical protein
MRADHKFAEWWERVMVALFIVVLLALAAGAFD